MPKNDHVRTANDQRSDALNPTSAEYKAAVDHNSNIHNPNSYEYQASLDNWALQVQKNSESQHEE